MNTPISGLADEVRVLNLLMMSQSLLTSFPTAEGVLGWVAQALKEIPGVESCAVCVPNEPVLIGDRFEAAEQLRLAMMNLSAGEAASIQLPSGDHLSVFRLQSGTLFFGDVLISVTSRDALEPFQAAAGNFVNSAAMNLQTRQYVAEIDYQTQHLEKLVTERTARLAESEEQYHQLFSSASDPLFLIDARTGDILDASEMASAVYGFDRNEFLARKNTDLSAEPGETLRLTQQVAQTSGLVNNVPLRFHRKKDGTVFPVEITYRRFYLRGQACLMVSCRDISERKQLETALLESQERLRLAADATSDGIWDWNVQTNEVYYSPRWKEMLGLTDDEVGNDLSEWDKRLHPADRAAAYDAVRKHLDGEVAQYVSEHRLLCKDGTWKWILDRGKVVSRTADGKPLRVVGAHSDISKLMQAQQALRESEERHRTILNTAMDGFAVSDMEGRLLEVNEAYCRMSGYSAKELLGRRISDLGADETPGDIAARMQRIIARGSDRFEFRHRRKDGSVFDVEIASQYQPGDGGRLIAFLRDITDRKKIEQEMVTLVTAVEQSDQTVVITDAEGIIRYCNPAFEKISGYSEEEAIGQTPRLLKSGRHSQEFYAEMWSTIKSGKVWTGHLTNKKKDSSLYEEDVSISPISDRSGKTVGFLAVKRDVTEWRHMEDQLRLAQRLESVGRLAGGVAHEFNNLLTVMNGYSCLLAQELHTADPLHAYAEAISTSGERAANLTRQLLAFGRKQMLQPRALDVNAAVRALASMLQSVIGENIAIVTNLDAALGQVMADPDQLDQVMMNLVLNARDAMSSGGRLEIATANVALDRFGVAAIDPDATPGRYVLMTLTDTGHGMDEATCRRIFEPFFTTKGVGEGTGLGLATVYGIIRQSKGWITARSEVGVGTSFSIYLPRIDAVPAPAVRGIGLPSAGGCQTILLIEDEPSVLSFTRAVLNGHGYQTLEASTGEDALQVAARHSTPIQLLLTDVVLPAMNGRETSEKLRKIYPDLKVIFTSGYPKEVIGERGVLAGDVAFLQKPFSPDALAAKVLEVLAGPAKPLN